MQGCKMKRILFILIYCLFSFLCGDEIDSLYYYDPDSLEDIGYLDAVSNIAVYFDMDENIEYDLLKLKVIFSLGDKECQGWIYVHKNDSIDKPGTVVDSIDCYFPKPDSQYYWYSRTFDLSGYSKLKKLQDDCWLSGSILMGTPGKIEGSGYTFAYWITYEKWYNDAPDIPVKIIFNKKEKSNAVDMNNSSYLLSSLNIFPNPFNSSTVIQFALQKRVGNCSLIIYNLKGNQVFLKKFNLYENNFASIIWTPEQVISSGVYFAVLKTDYEVLRQKMIYLK